MHVRAAACPQQHHLSSLIVFGGDELLRPATVLAGQCLDQRQLQSVMLHKCRAHPGTESNSSTTDSDTCAVDAETGDSLCYAQRRPYLIFNMLYAHIL